jgi:hypothetical protein
VGCLRIRYELSRSVLDANTSPHNGLISLSMDDHSVLGEPVCHGTDPDNAPISADSATKQARTRAWRVFSRLWNELPLGRDCVQIWMALRLGIDSENVHIDMLTREQCEELVRIIFNDFPLLKNVWDLLDDD